jgi:hypothetical protein
MIPIRASMASPPFFGDQEQGLRGRLLFALRRTASSFL